MERNKRGQVAIFVIVAIVIVLGVVAFAAYKSGFFAGSDTEFNEVYSYYDQCVKDATLNAVDLAGSQGGRIDSGEYIPGSDFMPFSSQLNFLGFPVPYWYYVSGNGVIKENVPTKADVEKEMEVYLTEKIVDCNFEEFFQRGYDITLDVKNVKVSVQDEKIDVNVESDLNVQNGEKTARVTSRNIEVNTKFGKMLSKAYELYEKETKEAFLENYSLDVLNLYAPVDGVEIQCSPRIWKANEVVDELQSGLEANIGALRFGNKGNTKEDYFIVNYDAEGFDIRALYSRAWPWKVEIYGAENGLMVAEPVGNQQGMGILGFCYAPYHFVYDISYPVMLQIVDGEEIFQFPFAVIIDKNVARQAEFSEIFDSNDIDLCSYATEDIDVKLFDNTLSPVDGELYYECFNQRCSLGKSSNGIWTGKAPACVNGVLNVRSDNYNEKSVAFSTNSEKSKEVVLSKLYDTKVELYANGERVTGNAYMTFSGEKNVFANIPDNENVQIVDGAYNLTVYIYENSSLKIPESTKSECRQVPQSGIAGFFGATDEKCFDITIPAASIDYALIGGGKGNVYVLEDQLKDGVLRIDAEKLEKPSTLEDLQNNYASFNELNVQVNE